MEKLYPEFFNDVFGPIMQPGSSSHMAGPCRAGLLCNALLDEDIADILIELDSEGSIAGTFGTMSEDLGMLNGAVGHAVDHPDFFSIKEELEKRNIPYEFRFCSMKESPHSNAMKFILTGRSGKKVSLVANSIGGGMVETEWVNGYRFAGKGDTWVLCVYDPETAIDAEKLSALITASQDVMESGTGEGQSSGVMHWYKLSSAPSEEVLKGLEGISWGCLKPLLPVPTTAAKQPQLFDTMTEWRRIAAEENKSMYEVAIDYEAAASGWSREQIVGYMRDVVLKTLNRRVFAIANDEIVVPKKPFFQETWRNWGGKMEGAPLVKGLFAKSLYYVFSARVLCPGVLNVPGPMGSGGGFIAGVLFAVKEELNLTDEDILRGLFVAAGVGAICYTRTEPTGEMIGCTGECGVCSAMAAAAVAEMLHGTPQQVENAASFALQAAVGWPCDIIPGGYGMPCASRIMYVAVMSITYAQFALFDEDPVLPFHEVVDVADRVGKSVPPGTHCNGSSGMCMAPTAQQCKLRFQEWREQN